MNIAKAVDTFTLPFAFSEVLSPKVRKQDITIDKSMLQLLHISVKRSFPSNKSHQK